MSEDMNTADRVPAIEGRDIRLHFVADDMKTIVTRHLTAEENVMFAYLIAGIRGGLEAGKKRRELDGDHLNLETINGTARWVEVEITMCRGAMSAMTHFRNLEAVDVDGRRYSYGEMAGRLDRLMKTNAELTEARKSLANATRMLANI